MIQLPITFQSAMKRLADFHTIAQTEEISSAPTPEQVTQVISVANKMLDVVKNRLPPLYRKALNDDDIKTLFIVGLSEGPTACVVQLLEECTRTSGFSSVHEYVRPLYELYHNALVKLPIIKCPRAARCFTLDEVEEMTDFFSDRSTVLDIKSAFTFSTSTMNNPNFLGSPNQQAVIYVLTNFSAVDLTPFVISPNNDRALVVPFSEQHNELFSSSLFDIQGTKMIGKSKFFVTLRPSNTFDRTSVCLHPAKQRYVLQTATNATFSNAGGAEEIANDKQSFEKFQKSSSFTIPKDADYLLPFPSLVHFTTSLAQEIKSSHLHDWFTVQNPRCVKAEFLGREREQVMKKFIASAGALHPFVESFDFTDMHLTSSNIASVGREFGSDLVHLNFTTCNESAEVDALFQLGEKHCPRLKTLNLQGCNNWARDEVFARIPSERRETNVGPFPSVVDLNLSNLSHINSVIGLANVVIKFPNLVVLNLRNCPCIDQGTFTLLSKLEHLTELDLSHCHNIRTAHVDIAQDSVLRRNLKSLKLYKCVGLDRDGYNLLIDAFRNLTTLDIGGMKEDNVSSRLAITNAIESLDFLVSLSIHDNPSYTEDSHLNDLGKKFSRNGYNLQHLDISNCGTIQDFDLEPLRSIKTLKKINLNQCSRVTRNGKQMLKKAIPGIEIL